MFLTLSIITIKNLFKHQIKHACGVTMMEWLSFYCLGPRCKASSLNPYFFEFAGCVQRQQGYLMSCVSHNSQQRYYTDYR